MTLPVFLLVTIVTFVAVEAATTIPHKTVQPFLQPEPVTISEKTGVKFKPQLRIDSGCRPYPAVNAASEVSGGVSTYQEESTGSASSPEGTHNRNPKILGVSPSGHGSHSRIAPPSPDIIDGTSVKVNYEAHWPKNHELSMTNKGGETQDLIMWDQMTYEARDALNWASFRNANVPFKEGTFINNLKSAWPW
ncbi:unnamed protein product [Phytophthora lilii]|uniref:Unnamed protein product n=1 Tax=Phytophthora lilii TaxID=2077276 RepID=A0A9W6U0L5_9STRA|nr:unnamed protein product [Phytophthora lilii]